MINKTYAQAATKNIKIVPGAAVLFSATDATYPVGASGKVLEEIDKRIFLILEMMRNDVGRRNSFSLSARACLLLSTLKEYRALGVPVRDYIIEFEDRFVECGHRIVALLEERDKYTEKLLTLEARLKENDTPLVHEQIDFMNRQWFRIINEIKPYIGQLNSFADQLEVCSHSFGKINATPERITAQDVLSVLNKEKARISARFFLNFVEDEETDNTNIF